VSADPATAVARGVRLFNQGRYLSAQQVWEACWRDASAADRGFLEGLVQLAGGLHLRTRRGSSRGALNLLKQALITLDDYRPSAHGVDLEALVTDFNGFVEWLTEIRRPHRLLDRLRIPRLR